MRKSKSRRERNRKRRRRSSPNKNGNQPTAVRMLRQSKVVAVGEPPKGWGWLQPLKSLVSKSASILEGLFLRSPIDSKVTKVVVQTTDDEDYDRWLAEKEELLERISAVQSEEGRREILQQLDELNKRKPPYPY